MSNIFIVNLVGHGTYAMPTTDAALAAATAGLDALIDSIANFNYTRVLAWVQTAAGATANRTLNCVIEQFDYNGEECPDTTETVTMTAAIETTLEGDPQITAIGNQHVHIFEAGVYFLWSRDTSGGYLYPTTTTDDVGVGAGLTGMWFNDGDMVLGAAAMAGTERLRVVGTSYLEDFVGINTVPVAIAAVDLESPTSGGTIYGARVRIDTTANITTLYGFQSRFTINAGDTATVFYNFFAASPTIDGTATNYYGFYVAAAPAGVTGNSFAVRLSDQAAGTLNYGIFQEGADDDNYFAGRLGLNDSTPSFPIDVAGDVNVQGGSVYRFNGVQIAQARRTGWVAPTGVAARNAIGTGVINLQQLAEHVKALIDDSMSHGFIGV
jgi:hypothetical protein